MGEGAVQYLALSVLTATICGGISSYGRGNPGSENKVTLGSSEGHPQTQVCLSQALFSSEESLLVAPPLHPMPTMVRWLSPFPQQEGGTLFQALYFIYVIFCSL